MSQPDIEWPKVWGRRTERARIEAGLTQEELAKRAKTTQQTVSRVENGQVTPRDGLKTSLADALGVRVAELFSWDPEHEEIAS